MGLPAIVDRTIGRLETPQLENGAAAKVLASALCAACAAKGIRHGMQPSDMGDKWRWVEDCIDGWFATGSEDFSTVLHF